VSFLLHAFHNSPVFRSTADIDLKTLFLINGGVFSLKTD
jgi:hypothetical protein